ncbi:SRPBCC family protein [Synechococcus sp. CBW1004]|jgi:ribosome-associated toxin RatA of RatAB toxin-antitoxin module|uniref:SRPBCC family protein n=1 Tax=Synechococcus sp. CBW1004 TaxID=1353136 RepID=UPI001E443150|nr:SRPBCC family protein [Synechococcus sp. CBW1004]
MVLAQPLAQARDLDDPRSAPFLSFPDTTCTLDSIQQDMERLPMGMRRLAVQLRLAVDSQWLWAVLTDYDNLHRFIPNLASSRQIWRRSNRVAVEQVGTQQFCGLRFSARVTLELEEERASGRLAFRMLDGDFRCFQGTWLVGSDATSSWLLYDLTVQGKPGMPIGLIEQRLQEDLANNVRGVQQEAQRRAAHA